MSRSIPRFPHGSSPQTAFAIWSLVVKCVFLACLFLFSRAFLLDSQGHLAFSRANNGTGTFDAVASDHYQGGTLPPCWTPYVAGINLTYELVPDPYDPNPYCHPPASESAAAVDETSGAKQKSPTARSGNTATSLETNSTLPDSPSSAIHDPSVTQREISHNSNPGQEGYSIGENIAKDSVSTQTVLSKENNFPSNDDNLHHKVEAEPFFSLEEFDGDGDIFALKIWVKKKEHLRAKLGEVDYCQGPSGVKCLPDN